MSAQNFWRVDQGLTFVPHTSSPATPSNGAMFYNSTVDRFQGYMAGAFSSIPGIDTTDTLTNKTISGSSNTLSNIADGSLSTSYVKADGSRALTANWAAGAFQITANSVQVGSAANTISQLSTIINTGTLTLPTATDTLVGRSTTDTLTNKILTGVTDASSAASGKVGELLDANSGGGGSPTYQTATGNNQYFDIASVTLSAGDWDIYIQGEWNLNASTVTEISTGVSTTSGNSSTGLVNGRNFVDNPLPISTDNIGFSLPYHDSISGSTTYYLKGFASYSAGTPQARGYIWARRRR